MRTLLVLAALVLTACPSTGGPPGPQGEKGERGEVGPAGPIGAAGPQGVQGPQGVEGPQGLQGPAGMVLVIDGGVVTGPAGAAVVVTPIAPGATCSTGGVRVTQLSDGGVSNVCNGAPGATGPTGATGPMGATGPQGPQGLPGTPGAQGPAGPQGATGLTGAQGPQGAAGPAGPQGATGLTGAQGPQGAVGPAGPQGATGLTGAQGPQGLQGAVGPTGPAGQVLFLDGGTVVTDWVAFVGFTAATFNGNLGGHVGANQKCDAEYAGAFLCTSSDYYRSEPTVVPPSSGAWVDYDRDAQGNRSSGACFKSGTTFGPWTESTNVDYAAFINASGYVTNGHNCDQVKPLACCRGASRMRLRGFTTATFNGALGGHPGANQKCQAEYPGSRFCTSADYYLSEPRQYPPSSGAWVDYDRAVSGARSSGACFKSGVNDGPWTESTNVDYAAFINASGYVINGHNCDQVKPLACCEPR